MTKTKRKLEDAEPTPKPNKKPSVPDLWQVTGVSHDQGLTEIAKLLPKGLKKCKQQVAHFFLFVYERQMVWERRNRGEGVYTDSLAMQNYFFCNNYRELDRGTNYFRAHVLNLWEKYNEKADHQKVIEIVLWASVCYRLVNRISTFEEFGGIPEVSDWPRFQAFMKKTAANKKVFTDAHITSGMGPFIESMSALYRKDALKIKQVSKKILACCQEQDLQGCFDAVKTIKGAGNFISWQVICDLMESQCLIPCTENNWTELGPGAKGGIDIIFGEGKHQDYSYLELAVTLQKIQDEVFDALGVNFPRFNDEPLTLKNIEHPLCEFKKYIGIHGSLRKNCRAGGQRLVRSRVAMDFDKACHNFENCGVSEDILFCDKCLVGFCEGCDSKNSPSAYWVCTRCSEFEGKKPQNGQKAHLAKTGKWRGAASSE